LLFLGGSVDSRVTRCQRVCRIHRIRTGRKHTVDISIEYLLENLCLVIVDTVDLIIAYNQLTSLAVGPFHAEQLG